MPKARSQRVSTLDDILSRNLRTRTLNAKDSSRMEHEAHMGKIKNVRAQDLSEFALESTVVGHILEAREFPSETFIGWVDELDRQTIAKLIGWYINNVASGIYMVARGKDASHVGNIGLAVVPYDDTDYSTALLFEIDETGAAELNLRKGTTTNKDGKALTIQAEHAVDDDGFTQLYLDAYTTGVAAKGLGSAITFRAQNANGGITTIGYLFFEWLDASAGAETGKVTLAVMEKGSLITSTLLAGTPYTVSLCHDDGTDGSTTITDEMGKVWTARGNAQLDTGIASPLTDGVAVLLLDGTGDWIDTPDHADWRLDAGSNANKWTVDCWVYFNGDPGTGIQGLFMQFADVNNHWVITLSNNTLVFFIRSGGVVTVSISNAWNPADATWYHVAVVKDGTNGYMMFINGTQIGTTQTDVDVMPELSGLLYVGVYTDSLGATHYLNGAITERRISKGIARWTTTFTPQTGRY